MVDIDIARHDPAGDGSAEDTESLEEIKENYDFSIYEEGDTKFKGDKHFGCFGLILMYFVHKNQEKKRRNQKSFISRNQQFRKELSKSVRKLKDRTVSMISIASTNWKQSRLSLTPSKTFILPGR